MIPALQILWLLWGVGALLAVLQVHKLHRRLRKELRGCDIAFKPKAWVIVPFKGVDLDLPGCVRSLCRQDYPAYRLVLVVDSSADPAYAVLQRELAAHPHAQAEILIAGPASATESQKIHNQLFALHHIEPLCQDDDLLVFADSDAVPGPKWLGDMAGPLCDRGKMGMTTGYRWLIPAPDPTTGRIAFWSHVASVINSSIACVYRQHLTSRAWGGAMALLVATARAGDLRRRLEGALTDDYQFNRLCWDLHKRIWFVPRSLVATPVHFTLGSLIAFARRQYVITRVYEPWTFLGGLLAMSLWVAGCASAWVVLVLTLVRAPGTYFWVQPAAAILVVTLANQLRAYYRRCVVREAFGPAVALRLRSTLVVDRWLTSFWMSFHWLMMVGACLGRTMHWRGISYRLSGPQNVRRLD